MTENTKNCYKSIEKKFIVEFYKLTEALKALRTIKNNSESVIVKNNIQYAINCLEEKASKIGERIEHYSSWRDN